MTNIIKIAYSTNVRGFALKRKVLTWMSLFANNPIPAQRILDRTALKKETDKYIYKYPISLENADQCQPYWLDRSNPDLIKAIEHYGRKKVSYSNIKIMELPVTQQWKREFRGPSMQNDQSEKIVLMYKV